MDSATSNPLVPIATALLSVISMILGVGIGWYLGRRSRVEEQEVLRKALEGQRGCWVQREIQLGISPSSSASDDPDTQ